MPFQIYLVEDHPIMRQGYAHVLAREPDLHLCGVAESAEEALDALEGASCDLLITDISLPGMDGVALIERVQNERPGLPVLVISAHDDEETVGRVRRAGAQGFLSKRGLAEALPPAIRHLLADAPFFHRPPSLSPEM